jgi:hypothetical protein
MGEAVKYLNLGSLSFHFDIYEFSLKIYFDFVGPPMQAR